MVGTFEPGWRWSDHVKPTAGTDRLQATHLVYVVSGRLHVAKDDGAEADVGPGAVTAIAPGQDAWVVGEEPCVAVGFGGYAHHSRG